MSGPNTLEYGLKKFNMTNFVLPPDGVNRQCYIK